MKKLEHKVPNLRFKGFTDYWEQHKLGEIITYYNGKSHEEQFRNAETQNFELVTLKSIDGNGNLCSSEKYIDSTNNTLSKNDLIMVLSEQNTGLVGMTTLIPRDNYYVLNQRVALLKLHKNNSPFFLTDAINQHQIFFERMSAGTKVQNISKSNVENFNLYIPNYSEQKEVGHIIALCQNIITLQQRKLDLLKQFKKGLLQKMFADKDSKRPVLRFKGFHDDWEQRKLGEISDIKSGLSTNTQSKKNLYKITRIETISDGFIDVKKVGTVREKPDKKFLMNCGDILFSNINSLKHIGKIAIFDGSFTLYHGMNLLRITVNTKTSSYFIYYELSTKKYRNWAKAHANPAVSQASINQSELSLENMSLTSLAEQEKIVNLLLLLDKLISLQQQKLAKYQSIKKSLLQQMFI